MIAFQGPFRTEIQRMPGVKEGWTSIAEFPCQNFPDKVMELRLILKHAHHTGEERPGGGPPRATANRKSRSGGRHRAVFVTASVQFLLTVDRQAFRRESYTHNGRNHTAIFADGVPPFRVPEQANC